MIKKLTTCGIYNNDFDEIRKIPVACLLTYKYVGLQLGN
jgi:hypothetical protein